MKKVFSLVLLIIVVILSIEFIITKLTKTYTNNYKLYVDKEEFDITEKYLKDNGDTYDIEIKNGNHSFYYAIDNNFNKQKKIINKIEFFKNNDDLCIYPVLKNKEPSYIMCSSNGNLYSSYTYGDQGYINNVINTLQEKGYKFDKVGNEKTNKFGTTTVYPENIRNNDYITLWQYKGIYVISNKTQRSVVVLPFDKYENKLGYLVDKYYIIPDYTNSNVLEFSSVKVINILTLKQFTINLKYILSSSTYINGVVDGKLYYTDPSNLLQISVDPKSEKVELVGDVDKGGKLYNGKWENANIYDFTNSEIQFKNTISIDNEYKDIKESASSYYYYTNDGSIYQALKNHTDKPILIYRASGINNLNVINNDIYYIVNDTLYNFNIINGINKLISDNDLIYNNYNRISVYR